MKHQYAIQYSVTTHYEAILIAKNKTQAIRKVVNIIGEPVTIESAYKLKSKNKSEK